jgi:hypothetical protein
VKKPARNKQLCVLCGNNPASGGQGDHIPPKSIYTPEERIKCNNAGKKSDEALKVLIGLDANEQQRNLENVAENVAKTLEKNNRLAKQLFSTATQVYAQRPSGIYEPRMSATFDEELYLKSMKRIVRAMYWKITGDIFDKDKEISVILDGHLTQKLNSLVVQHGKDTLSIAVNGETFRCELSDVNGMKIMKMVFFNSHVAIALL